MASGRRTAIRSCAQHYDATDLAPKRRIKQQLLEQLKLAPDIDAPLIGVVSRLVEQKGIDLLTRCCPRCCRTRARPSRCSATATRRSLPTLRASPTPIRRRVSFTEGYDEKLAHEIFAGSDLTVVPSRYEPCGLTQMYALRYGTIPVVRATGGLADTIQHFDAALGHGQRQRVSRRRPARRPVGREHRARAGTTTAPPGRISIGNAMAADFSWPKQVPHYEALYRSLL